MRALVGLLRRDGVLLRQPRRWRDGELRTEREAGAVRLVLRDLNRTGDNIVATLYRPQIVALSSRCLRVQGIEPMSTYDHRTAAVVQEWAVILFGMVPAETGGTYFSPAVLGQLDAVPAGTLDQPARPLRGRQAVERK